MSLARGLRIDFSSSFLDFMDSSSSTLGRRIHTFEGTKPLDHTSSSVLASSFPTTSSETSSPPPSKKPRLASPKTLPQRPTSSYHPKTRAAAKLLAGPVPKVQHD
ncbi:hypothetical protein HMI54_015092 [Coelomomyces lativittatus]|nr:hypothetical protein HMI54_015092 [Coelomomyces lativittatus]